MSIKIAISHHTEYRFDRLVSLSPHIIRLRPAPHVRTPIHHYSLKIEPGDHFINWHQDPFGNFLARVVFPNRTRRLSITVDVVAESGMIDPGEAVRVVKVEGSRIVVRRLPSAKEAPSSAT